MIENSPRIYSGDVDSPRTGRPAGTVECNPSVVQEFGAHRHPSGGHSLTGGQAVDALQKQYYLALVLNLKISNW